MSNQANKWSKNPSSMTQSQSHRPPPSNLAPNSSWNSPSGSHPSNNWNPTASHAAPHAYQTSNPSTNWGAPSSNTNKWSAPETNHWSHAPQASQPFSTSQPTSEIMQPPLANVLQAQVYDLTAQLDKAKLDIQDLNVKINTEGHLLQAVEQQLAEKTQLVDSL